MSLLGKTIGSIHIREILGEGGMGTVYLGFDERLRREVAVKALRGDRLDATTRARLLREARLLSQLDHPNICRIHEFVEGDDSDYLVLELIGGKDLRQALDDGVAPALRLSIALQVAQTLVAAHAKGIIHRDLKPANVMLTSIDAADPGLVKVLDFGIARSLGAEHAIEQHGDQALSEEGGTGLSAYVQTKHGSVLGTATSMSPEQARGESATAASDMYSFGLLLQEMFTGRPPYEPDLPQSVLLQKAADGDTLPVKGVESDLSALIERLKSLAPEARPSAAEAAERLRWIAGKPKRRRQRLAAAAAVAVLAAGGLKYTFDLRSERNLAVTAQVAAEQARAGAEQAREEAEQAREEAEQVTAFLVDLFKAPDPTVAQGEELTARQLLGRGVGKLELELENQPLVRARFLSAIGRTYINLGLYEDARAQIKKVVEIHRAHLPINLPDLAENLMPLANLERQLGGHDRAEQLYLEALAIREQAPNPEPIAVAEVLQGLGRVYSDLSDFDKAAEYLQRALESFETALGSEDPRIASSLELLAFHYKLTGALHRADMFYERLIRIQENVGGRENIALAKSLQGFAESYVLQERLSRAEPHAKRALEIGLGIYAPEHHLVAGTHMLLAVVEADQGHFAESERLFQNAQSIFENLEGPDGYNVGIVLGEYGRFRRDAGDPEQAKPMLERACRILEKHFGPDNFILTFHYDFLANHLTDQGHLAEAEAFYRRIEKIHQKVGSQNPRYLAKTLLGLGRVRLATGDLGHAIAVLERALALREEGTGADDPQLGSYLNALAQAKLARGEATDAESLYRRGLVASRRWLEQDPGENLAFSVLATGYLGLGEVAAHRGDEEKAQDHWHEAVAILEPLTAAVPKVDYLDPHACALLHLGRLDEAQTVARPLRDAGWRRPRFVALARRHGLLPED